MERSWSEKQRPSSSRFTGANKNLIPGLMMPFPTPCTHANRGYIWWLLDSSKISLTALRITYPMVWIDKVRSLVCYSPAISHKITTNAVRTLGWFHFLLFATVISIWGVGWLDTTVPHGFVFFLQDLDDYCSWAFFSYNYFTWIFYESG